MLPGILRQLNGIFGLTAPSLDLQNRRFFARICASIRLDFLRQYDTCSCVNASQGKQLNDVIAELVGQAPCGSLERNSNSNRDDLRFRILRLLENNPQMSHRQVARELGVSAGAVNYCINALIEKGFVKVRNFRKSDNKLRYVYLLTPEGVSEKLTLAHDFLVRKALEYQALRHELDTLVSELDDSNYGLDKRQG